MVFDNFISKDGRTLKAGDLVGVHWNAHKDTYSIVSMKSRKTTGLVLGYASQVTLTGCTTKIDASKQAKVIESGVKDRHAFIVGHLESLRYMELDLPVYYNPKKVEDFVDATSYFEEGRLEYIDNVSCVSLDYDFSQSRPVVTYAR